MIDKSAPEVGLVGCGAWGSLILRDLSSLGCRVHVVARSEPSQARAKLGGAHSIVGSVAELPSVEGIVVCTPTPTHASVAEESLRRGVPVFVEKPLTDDPEAAERLADRGAGKLFVMDKWRYHTGVLALAEIARRGELGPVQGVRTLRVGWGNPHAGSDSPWILAPHDLAIVLELLGRLPEARAARIERVGSTITGLTGWLGQDPWAMIEVSASSPRRERSVRIVCDGGSALLPDAYSDHVLIVRGDPQSEPDAEVMRRPVPDEMPLLSELRVFVEHLRGGPPPRSSASDGAKIVRILSDLLLLGEGQPVGSGAL